MKFIGLLMICGEDDILEQTLAINAGYVDHFYVLDGTTPNTQSRHICEKHPKCAGYTTDAELPRPPFPEKTVCGYRKHLHDQAVADHGPDNVFLILHGDEIWTADPRDMLVDGHERYLFQVPFFFPRAGEPWDYDRGPLDQLKWHLGPGFPEFRMFVGNEQARYDPEQHFDTMPKPLGAAACRREPILHYPYRAPDVQIARALHHQETGFDPDNYEHITHGEEVYWTDVMIARMRDQQCFSELGHSSVDEFLTALVPA